MKTRHALLPLALLLALTACGSKADGDGIASVGGTPTAAATSGQPSREDVEEMALKFAQCMREHGVDMPDPEIDGGRITQRINAGPGGSEKVEAAQEACKEYAPSGPGGGKLDQESRDQMLEHAKCMRENGVEKFPDPNPDEGGIRIDGGIAGDPDFKKAQEACDAKLGRPGAEK